MKWCAIAGLIVVVMVVAMVVLRLLIKKELDYQASAQEHAGEIPPEGVPLNKSL